MIASLSTYLPEDCVLAVEVGLLRVRDEELGLVRVRARVRHSQDTAIVELVRRGPRTLSMCIISG